jgi:hypothetical protein
MIPLFVFSRKFMALCRGRKGKIVFTWERGVKGQREAKKAKWMMCYLACQDLDGNSELWEHKFSA